MINKGKNVIRKTITTLLVYLIMILMFQSSVLAAGATSMIASTPAVTGEASTLLETRAGISAWFKNPSSIALDVAETAFRSVENKTSDYLVGTVQIRGLDVQYDAHVLVQKDGWIVAYYSNTDNIGRLYDSYQNTTTLSKSTTLYQALNKVASKLQVAMDTADVKYYDYRFPTANRLMIIRNTSNHSSYITIPANITLFQAGAAFASSGEKTSFCSVELDLLSALKKHTVRLGLLQGQSSIYRYFIIDSVEVSIVSEYYMGTGFGMILLYQQP